MNKRAVTCYVVSHFCTFLISVGSIKIFIQGAREKVRESEKFYAVDGGQKEEEEGSGPQGRACCPPSDSSRYFIHEWETGTIRVWRPRMDSFSAIKKVGEKKEKRKGERERKRERETESIVEFVQRFARRGFTVPGTRRPPGLSWPLLTGIWLPDVLRRSPLAHKSWNADRFIHRYRCT